MGRSRADGVGATRVIRKGEARDVAAAVGRRNRQAPCSRHLRLARPRLRCSPRFRRGGLSANAAARPMVAALPGRTSRTTRVPRPALGLPRAAGRGVQHTAPGRRRDSAAAPEDRADLSNTGLDGRAAPTADQGPGRPRGHHARPRPHPPCQRMRWQEMFPCDRSASSNSFGRPGPKVRPMRPPSPGASGRQPPAVTNRRSPCRKLPASPHRSWPPLAITRPCRRNSRRSNPSRAYLRPTPDRKTNRRMHRHRSETDA